ncbi:MAG TPA: hypothetical protein VN281_22145 [Verrucomicrobiae bacterium]|nr:hypothetical protein [Verrucomicrobiae bacterium]
MIVALLVIKIVGTLGEGRLKLPVGNGTPAICLGERHGLILASDGSLWSWGSDFLGWPVLGLGSNKMQSTCLRRVDTSTNWASISVESSRNLAIKSDGSLWTWGETVDTPIVMPRPAYMPVPAAPGNDWKRAAVGGVQFVAIKKDGTLWAWGHNWAGSVGIPWTNGSAVPIQVGSATNWTKIWAGLLETVGMQSDGSLWYWGENPNPTYAQGTNQVFAPMRINEDTSWVDVGFGVNTVFAIKSDGTLWTWGRNADAYTGATDPAQDAKPTPIGTNSDWRSFSSSADGWWITGLTKKDGSLWLMDASDGKSNGPRPPYKPVQFRRVGPQKDWIAWAGGATHAAPPGYHGPIGVTLTRDGEVWTWGMVLGDPPTLKSGADNLAVRFARLFGSKADFPDPDPVFRDQPWQLRNIDSQNGAPRR